jgi:hypothetical protein
MHNIRFLPAGLLAMVLFSMGAARGSAPVPLTAAALSNGWDIKKMALNDNGAVLFAGGDFQGMADGIVFSAPSRFYRIANLGYEPPGTPGLVYAGFPGRFFGDLALNKAEDVVFSASLVACDQADVDACVRVHPRVNALFHYRNYQGDRIVKEDDPVPGREGYFFRTFDRIWLNAPGDIVFKAGISRAGMSELHAGLFLYSKGLILTVAVEGDPTIDLNSAKFSLAFSDAGEVLFFSPVANTVYRFSGGLLATVLAPGMAWSGGDEWRLETVYEAVPNRAGDVVFHGAFVISQTGHPTRQGVYLLRHDGTLDRILIDGDASPAGGRFVLVMETTDRFGGKHVVPISVPLKLNDDGMAVFAAPIPDGTSLPQGPFSTPAGLFSYRRGGLAAIVVAGDPRPDDPSSGFGFAYPNIEFDVNNTGLVAFNPDGNGIFLALNGEVAALSVRGGSTGLQEGTEYSIGEFRSFLLNGARTVAFQASICCGPYVQGIFLARPRTPSVPNGGFEAVEGGVPQNWSTWWTNFGTGDVAQYNSGGNDSYDWYSTMRMHVGAGGGAVFALSDPVTVSPVTAYMLESRMRFYFDYGDTCFFTIIEYDSAGNQVGENEVLGYAGDSYWSWSPMRVLLHTAPNAAFLRYRFGLVSSREKYLDVDALQ